MIRLLYSFAIGCYATAVRCAAPFHTKAAAMRKGWRAARRLDTQVLVGRRVAWFHASSLGEFEQARPVLERFRAEHPEYKVALTFFSPSGYEVRHNYSGADLVCYLPPDTRRNARRFVEQIHPDIAFFVKYDFWFNYLQQLQRRQTPTYLFSAIFRPSQYFFKPYGRWFARQLQCYTHLFVQNEESLTLLRSIGVSRCSRAGDTRFDRVHAIAQQAQPNATVDRFLEGYDGAVLMAGSSWEPDEERICDFLDVYRKPLRVILAPHVISESHLSHIEQLFGADRCVRYSELAKGSATRADILIIDNIGMLAALYRYATVACIGGGFGKGIHNILEAATFLCPVCFGPNYQKFQEARDLIAAGGARSFQSSAELSAILTGWLDDDGCRREATEACRTFLQANLGATDAIMEKITAP